MKLKTPDISSIATLSALMLLASNITIASDYDDVNEREYHYYGKKYSNAVYQVKLHNDTQIQWFSPYLCALHHNRLRLFEDGRAASTGQATFAEDGFSGILAKELEQNPYVYAVIQSGPGLIPPDGTLSTYIKGPVNARLTCAAMPVTTNDVLTVVHRVRTPKYINGSYYHSSTEWDLGSENNNYSASSMPEDSANLVPEGPDNLVTISENMVFGSAGRPAGVPSLLSPFTRSYLSDDGKATAEGTMSVFEDYAGSDEFPAEVYGWSGSASHVSVTRVK